MYYVHSSFQNCMYLLSIMIHLCLYSLYLWNMTTCGMYYVGWAGKCRPSGDQQCFKLLRHGVVKNAPSIVTFFTSKYKVLSIFREHSKLELKNPSSTRFAYMWILLERLYNVKSTLRQTVVSTMWDESGSEEAKDMQRQCLNEEFWVRVRTLVMPFYRVLRMTDMEGATLGLIHFTREAKAE